MFTTNVNHIISNLKKQYFLNAFFYMHNLLYLFLLCLFIMYSRGSSHKAERLIILLSTF